MLVVARFNEDVEWTRAYPQKIIYNKGDKTTIPEDLHAFVQDLPNVGREAHTYIHHIVQHYDTLDDVTVFTQADYLPHISEEDFAKLFDITDASHNLTDSSVWMCGVNKYNFRISNWGGPLTPSKYDETYGQWYERVFDAPFVHGVHVYKNGIFSVHKSRIRKYPKAFYEKLLSELDYCHSPETAHFMERTWAKMFQSVMRAPTHKFLQALSQSAFSDTQSIYQHTGDVDGWMCPEFAAVFEARLQALYAQRQRPLTIFEVGTWKGLSALTMCNVAKRCNIPVHLVCIDTWLGAPEFWTWGQQDPTRGLSLRCKNGYPQVYYTFLRNVVDHQHQDAVIPFPISSNEAVEVLTYHGICADIIYVDAAHEYAAVKNDLQRFWSRLETGGVMLGDDYTEQWPGVIQAVDEFSTEQQRPKEVHGVCWVISKDAPENIPT